MILFEKLLTNVAKKPKFVHFEDREFEKYCLANYDKDGDGKISIEEALSVTTISEKLFAIDTGNFSDLRYFENVTEIPPITLNGYRDKLKRLEIPKGVKYLGRYSLGFATPVIIVFHGKTPPTHAWTFSYTTKTYDTLTNNGGKIYVPDESVEDYKKAFTSDPTPLGSGKIIYPISEFNK